jgi:hypothetical protein
MDWLDSTKRCMDNGILWIKGEPGAGKTTLLECAVRHTQGLSESAAVFSSFFHARGSALERPTEGMYRSLLIQILDKVPGLQLVLDKQRPKDTWAVKLMSNLFREVIMALVTDLLVYYIDAMHTSEYKLAAKCG